MTFEKEHALETYKSMISVGTEALKALQLINGGAVVALLAYLGQAPNRSDVAKYMDTPFAFFIAGLLTATIAFLFTYLTQFALLNEFYDPKVKGIKHMTWLRVTIGTALASVGLFAVGAFTAVDALIH